ncbi:MAG: DeoR/GlpR family DNA-binding transcription regulator [Erysipelotrichaceae bacterium]|uniref:DeoR/GlpR family DNA-binding transcription regulator n=1 Tax=Floccifex sp. TaxID=2815810 RepID=UPI0029FEE265|nr:DeoR family transcriptional regulator [Floccifex sp.]MDD7281258.1 DeoR/GlpR family DNA-binding transcription regulator [Erysipelotrichaceae bacterium]MDY2958743.1 DeoR/GlpR family DNA-binding transcription regulator [Floccifex sp.]
MPRNTKNRRDQIYQKILNENSVRIVDLASEFKVSSETIRKDLSILESQQLITKKHGIAEVNQDYNQLPLDIKMGEHIKEKEQIAKKALDYIQDNSIIFLDPGSTTLALCKYLPLKKNLTIVTNSLAIAQVVSNMKHDLLFLGGKLQKRGKSMVGVFAMQTLEKIQIDIAFMGCDGFLNTGGPTTFSLEEMLIKQQVLSKSKQKILLCDASKFRKQGTYTFAKFSDYDVLITNPISKEEKELCQGVKKLEIA